MQTRKQEGQEEQETIIFRHLGGLGGQGGGSGSFAGSWGGGRLMTALGLTGGVAAGGALGDWAAGAGVDPSIKLRSIAS